MTAPDMARVARLLVDAVRGTGRSTDVRDEVRELAGRFPPYPG